jgi:tetratricopeptide (TPR) repeat protein
LKKIGLLTAAVLLAAACLFAGCAKTEAKSDYEEGVKELKAGDYEAAGTSFSRTVEAGEFLAEAYRGEGLSYMCQSDYADACIAFEKSLLNIENQSADFTKDVNLYLAYCRTRHSETDKAMEIYNSLLKKETDPEVLFLRGRLFMQTGDETSAKTDFDKAASLSTDYNLFINIYEIYDSCGKDADGADYLEQALNLANQSASDYYNKGLVNYYLENYSEAKDNLIKAIQENGKDSGAILLLGKVYLSMDDTADARAMFKEHISDKDSAAAAYNGLALCDMADGSYDSALSNVQSGLALDDESANQSLRFNEIVIYEHQHDWSTAKTKAAAYVGYYPTDEMGLRENEFLSSR